MKKKINFILACVVLLYQQNACKRQIGLIFFFICEEYSADENPNHRLFSSASVSVEETPSGTATFSVAVGMLVALVGLLALLVFLQYRKLRKGYTPLMEAHFNNKRYTEEA